MSERMDVRYARSGDIDIAYYQKGEGPDIVFVPGFVSHLDLLDEVPFYGGVVRDLGRMGRVTTFDKRGTGLSDRSLGFGSTADRMDDIRAVMDAAGIERAALMGVSEGGPLATVFAATYPDRVTKLALYGTYAHALRGPDHPIGWPRSFSEQIVSWMRDNWGTGQVIGLVVQNIPAEMQPVVARFERNACTPKMVEQIMQANISIDIRDLLPAISVPTLVAHSKGDPLVPLELGRYLAENIEGARMIEVDADVHGDWNYQGLVPELLEFLTGAAPPPSYDRMLATVLFTDIVSSTEHDVRLGDRRWRELLDRHDEIAGTRIERYQGRLVKTTGDGFLATFDGPARAIACAREVAQATKPLGIDIRAGLHTGEVELRGEDITGLGVVIARRVCDLAAANEVLASRTVKDLVAGSGVAFEDRGAHRLKGVPDDWHLYAVC